MHGKHIYLQLGDTVAHRSHEEWGEGVVEEEMTSSVPGGTCLVRIRFEDGRQRTFNNDMDNELCCYYFGVRKFWRAETDVFDTPERRTRSRLARR